MKPYEFLTVLLLALIFGASTKSGDTFIMVCAAVGLVISGIRAVYYATK